MDTIDTTMHVSRIEKQAAIMMPQGLSTGGQIFWRFMCDLQKALENEPRDFIRSNLIQCFRNDLALEKPANEHFMELDCDFIQWLFPLETIGVNPKAPIVTKNDHKILGQINDFKSKMVEHFLLFTEFMGLKYDESKGTFQKINAKQWKSWIEHPHNNLRISRVLTSMKDFGLEKVACDFLEFLKDESNRQSDEIIQNQVFRQFTDITRKSCKDFWSSCL